MNRLSVKLILTGSLFGLVYFSNAQILKQPITPITKPVGTSIEGVDVDGFAKQLKEQNKTVNEAATAIKNKKYNANICFRALAKANYDSLNAAVAVKNVYALNAGGVFTNIPSEGGIALNTSKTIVYNKLRFTKHCFPEQSFEQLLTAGRTGKSDGNGDEKLFIQLCRLLGYTNSIIVEKGLSLHNSNLLQFANEMGYPTTGRIFSAVKEIKPSTNNYELYALIISKGYNVNDVFNEIPHVFLNSNGSFNEEVGSCFVSSKPNSQTLNQWIQTKVQINPNPDGSYNFITNNINCYNMFLKKLNQNKVSRANMEAIAYKCIDCVPAGAACENAKNQLKVTMVNTAISN